MSTINVLILVACIATLVLVTGLLYLGHLIWVAHEKIAELQRRNWRQRK